MSKNKELGQEGEQLATDYLKKSDWRIVARNYRHKKAEIDLIDSKDDLLIFVEVKARSNIKFGLPEQFVDKKKAENIISAADHFIRESNWNGNIRFEIISIVKKNGIELKHIEDAFY